VFDDSGRVRHFQDSSLGLWNHPARGHLLAERRVRCILLALIASGSADGFLPVVLSFFSRRIPTKQPSAAPASEPPLMAAVYSGPLKTPEATGW
jgi:hypothetical protein